MTPSRKSPDPPQTVSTSGDRPASALLPALGFLALALLWSQVGYLLPSVARPLGGVVWLTALAIAGGKRRWLWMVAYAVLLFNPWGAVHRWEGLLLLGALPWAAGRWGGRWMGAAWLAALGGFLWGQMSGAWVALDETAAGMARWLAGADLSAAAAGFPLLALAACFPLAALLIERRLYPNLVALGALILALPVYWWAQRGLEVLLHRWGWHMQHDAFSLQWLLLILLGTVLTAWGVFHPPPHPVPVRRRLAWLAPALALLGLLFVGWTPRLGAPERDRQIVLLDQGYMNWRVPQYGVYGQHAAGMFGLLPEYLRWRGFETTVRDTLTADLLDSSGVVIVINLQNAPNPDEMRALHDFVERGGSLLLAGDHTGLSGIREPSNAVLSPYGIELNFDSAIPTRTGWAGSLLAAAHPLTARFRLDRLDPTGNEALTHIWIGASLEVTPPARPVIMGREGFSDLGNVKNEQDGYLGDFRYKVKERLGDVVLMAEARVGRGKVLVFGDTSTLQNGALVRAGDFVAAIFDYLLAPKAAAPALLRFAGILLLAAAVVLWGFSGGNGLVLAVVVAATFAGGWISRAQLESAAPPPSGWSAEAPPRALIDHSHAPRAPLNQVSDDSHWGLQNVLMRSGFAPRTLERWNPAALDDARILVEIAPAKGFNAAQRRDMRRFMDSGGIVLLSCGAEEFDGSRSLLQDYGFEPLYVPLGPAQIDTVLALPADNDTSGAPVERAVTITFHEAWETRSANAAALSLLDAYGKPLVLFAPVGRGGLVFIPDTDFLTNRNLESPSDKFDEGNILFLRHLLRERAGGK